MQKILPLAVLLVLTSSIGTCGGNCPSSRCSTCDCGDQMIFPDLDQLCGTFEWEKNCCKCIILRNSDGNTNQIAALGWEGTVYRSGLAAFNFTQCNYSNKGRCEPNNTLGCMFELYSKTNDWSYWSSDAAACGCLSNQLLEVK